MNRRLSLLSTIVSAAVVAVACTTASSPPAGGGSPSAGGSPPPASVEPAASEPAASVAASPSVAAASQPAASAGGSTGAAKDYKCPDLITDAEIQAATGVDDLADLSGSSDGSPDGFTDCGYFGKSGALYVQVSVWTGPSKAGFDQLVAAGQASGAVEPLPGIGDSAGFAVQSDEAATAAAEVGDTGITVAWQAMSDGGLSGIDMKAASQKILETVVGRLQ